MRRVLLLMKTESYKAKDFIEAAVALGVELVVGSDAPDVLAGFAPGSTRELDFFSVEQSTREIEAMHRERPFDAVVAAEDEGTVLAARAAALLGLPGNPAESVASARNKVVAREIMAAAGLEVPWFRRYGLSVDPGVAAREVPYPCVLKPISLSASRGVIRADEPDDFVIAFRRVAALLQDPEVREKSGAEGDSLLVESFIPGAEVAIEGMLREGRFHLLACFDKPEPMDGPFFEETLFITPSRHPASLQERALAAAAKGVEALGLRSGPVHVELRLNGEEVFLLEISPRSIGGHCSRVLRFGSGMTLEELVLRQALGIAPDEMTREGRAAGVMMIPIPASGTLHAVKGLERARGVPAVEGVEISIPLTQPVVRLPEGNRYLGFIFAKAERPDTVERALREAHEHLTFDIR
jgi:biotin carboxylase